MILLILYPPEFNSYSKFQRKINNILGDKTVVRVIFPADKNGLIRNFFKESFRNTELLEKESWVDNDITHAIIFDDGEEFSKETCEVIKLAIPLRQIKIKITRVVNIDIETQYQKTRSTDHYQYIGRGSYWGNPYAMYVNGDDREEVIRKFKYDFDFDKFAKKEKEKVYKLSGKRLGCFCKPKACHGDVLADFLNSWDDGE